MRRFAPLSECFEAGLNARDPYRGRGRGCGSGPRISGGGSGPPWNAPSAAGDKMLTDLKRPADIV